MTDTGRGDARIRRGQLLIYGSVFLFTASEAAIHLLVPAFLSVELRLGPAAVGAIISAFGVSALVARLPVGLAYRRSRAAWISVLGGMCATAAYLLIPIVRDPFATAALLALDGAGWSAATTVLLAALADDHDRERSTSAAMGWYLGFIGLGNAAAGIGGVLADLVGLTQAFLLLAAAPAVATISAALALGAAGGPPPSVAPAAPAETPQRSWVGQLVQLSRSMPAVVWGSVVVMVHINLVNGLLNAFHPVLALRAGLSLSEIGLLSSVRSIASSWTRLASGPIFTRLPAVGLTGPLVVLGTAVVAVVPAVAWSFWLQIPLFVALGCSRGLLRVSASTVAFDAARGSGVSTGAVSAVLHAGLDAGRLAGPLIAGLVAEVAGLPASFVIVPLMLAAGYAAFGLRARRRRDGTPPPTGDS